MSETLTLKFFLNSLSLIQSIAIVVIFLDYILTITSLLLLSLSIYTKDLQYSTDLYASKIHARNIALERPRFITLTKKPLMLFYTPNLFSFKSDNVSKVHTVAEGVLAFHRHNLFLSKRPINRKYSTPTIEAAISVKNYSKDSAVYLLYSGVRSE